MKKNNRFKIDTYKEGGSKSEWISKKIGVLMGEGKYSQDQATAIAYSMYNKEHNSYQDGGMQSNLKNIYDIQPNVYNPSMGEGVKVFYRDPSDPQFLADRDSEFVKNEAFNLMKDTKAYNDYTNRINSNTAFVPTKLYGEYEKPTFAQQKSIRDIKYNVQTNKTKQGLPEGTYTKVYYNDGTVDYLDAEGQRDFQKMSNYRNYISSKKEPSFNSNPIASYQEGGWYEHNPPLFTSNALQPSQNNVYVGQTRFDNELISLSDEQLSDDTPMVEDMTIFTSPEQKQRMAQNRYINTLTNNYDENGNAVNTNPAPNFNQPYQFFNPYVGVDLATGAQVLGRGIQSGDTLDIATGGLKTLAGTARNVFAGMGQEKVQQEALKNYYDNQRDSMTGYYQDGGEQLPASDPQQVMQMVQQALQQGISPEEIAQQLIQMGLSEEQVMQIIQSAMQQGQAPQQSQMQEAQQPQMRDGGSYLDMLKGKKIKDYKFNPETNSYDVEFE